ncbi:MAG: nitrilase-related carbon-nitrogen hydrolase [Candidatus Bathyarchaeia archaeon]
MKICAVQLLCKLGDKKANLQRIERWLKDLHKGEPDLILFPELSTTGYNPLLIGERFRKMAEPIPGPTTERLSKEADEYNTMIVLGIVEREGEKIYNSAAMVEPNGQISKYRKAHLFGYEPRFFDPGEDYPVFNTERGCLGLMICYDSSFPEVARILALKGAELILVPSAWRYQDRDIWRIVINTRAFENTVYVAASNRIGIEGDLHLFGNSKIIDPRGLTISEGEFDNEVAVFAELDLGKINKYRDELRMLRDRKPHTYGEILKPQRDIR